MSDINEQMEELANRLEPETGGPEEGVDNNTWWEECEKIGDKWKNNEEVNTQLAARLYRRVCSLHESNSENICWIRKLEAFYNLDRTSYSYLMKGVKYSLEHTTLNLVRIGVNAIHSMIGKETPQIGFVTDDADSHLQEHISRLDQYIASEFEASELYRNVRAAVRDAACSRLGTVKVWFDDHENRFRTARIPPLCLLVDDTNQDYDKKFEVFERRIVSKAKLKKMFARESKNLEKMIDDVDGVNGCLMVFEAYYKDGVRVVFTSDFILHMEEWEGMPPYFHWRWTQKTNSFWGTGIADEAWPQQKQINKIDLAWVRNTVMLSVPRVIVTGNARFTATELTNKEFGVLKLHGSGVGPNNLQFVIPNALNQQQLDKRRDMLSEFMQQTGLSQFMSTGEKEAGVYSGASARVVHSIQSARFAEASRSLLDMYVDIARYMVKIADNKFSAAMGREQLLPYQIDWDAIDINKNYFKIKDYPINVNSMDIDARMKYAFQMMQMGVASPQDALELLQFPDIHKYRDMITATKRDVRRRLENIVKGIDESINITTPTFIQHAEAVKFYNMELQNGMSEDSAEAQRLRAFIAKALKAESRKAAAARMQQARDFQMAQGMTGSGQQQIAKTQGQQPGP